MIRLEDIESMFQSLGLNLRVPKERVANLKDCQAMRRAQTTQGIYPKPSTRVFISRCFYGP